MQRFQNISAGIELSDATYHSGNGVLQALQLLNHSFWCTIKHRVAIVDIACNKEVNDLFRHMVIKVFLCLMDFLKLNVTLFADGIHMFMYFREDMKAS